MPAGGAARLHLPRPRSDGAGFAIGGVVIDHQHAEIGQITAVGSLEPWRQPPAFPVAP